MTVRREEQHFTFVLVHGGWCSGEVFVQLTDLLRVRGHRVYAPDLTGCGARSHLLRADIGLNTHIQDIVNTIKWANLSNVVLVGHSYGGMVITGVASEVPELIDSIVYLDAFLPADGQALIDLIADPEAREPFQRATASGASSVPFPRGFADALGVPEEDLWKFTPHPIATLFDPIASTAGLSRLRKRTFVWATQSPDLEKDYERLQKDSSWNTVAVPAGHMLQWEVPERCVEILEEAAA